MAGAPAPWVTGDVALGSPKVVAAFKQAVNDHAVRVRVNGQLVAVWDIPLFLSRVKTVFTPILWKMAALVAKLIAATAATTGSVWLTVVFVAAWRRYRRGLPLKPALYVPVQWLVSFTGMRAVLPGPVLDVIPLPRQVLHAVRGQLTPAEFNVARVHIRSEYFLKAKNRFGTPPDTVLMRETVRRWVANQMLGDEFGEGETHLVAPIVTQMVFAMSDVERRARDEVGLAYDAGRREDARSIFNLNTWRMAMRPGQA